MAELASFLSSENGKILSGVLLLMGLTDLIIMQLPALPFCKKRLELRAALLHTHNPEEKKLVQQQLQAQNVIWAMLGGTGLLFILTGIYGLTR